MSDFARLETHEGLQVLCRVEATTTDEGTYGPAVFTRCDTNVSVETKEGVWSDDDEGWDIAESFMAGKDLSAFAKSAIEMTKGLSDETGGTP